eukprot:m.103100 g.103100  ORF g.103100 m.103100 type:complete len:90 (-) comp15210_c0_seq3:980-1249(-)
MRASKQRRNQLVERGSTQDSVKGQLTIKERDVDSSLILLNQISERYGHAVVTLGCIATASLTAESKSILACSAAWRSRCRSIFSDDRLC